MKLPAWLHNIAAYCFKHWRWVLFLLCIVLWLVLPHKPFGAVLAGIAAMAFIWLGFAIVQTWNNPKP
jgi:hypothetical protein